MKALTLLIAAVLACGGSPSDAPQPAPGNDIHPGACGLPRLVTSGTLQCQCFNCECVGECYAPDGGTCEISRPDGGSACP